MIDLYLAFQGTVCLRSYVLGGFVDRVLVEVYDIELKEFGLGSRSSDIDVQSTLHSLSLRRSVGWV